MLLYYLTCLHTTTSILLSIHSLVGTISLKIWERHRPGVRNIHFRFRGSKASPTPSFSRQLATEEMTSTRVHLCVAKKVLFPLNFFVCFKLNSYCLLKIAGREILKPINYQFKSQFKVDFHCRVIFTCVRT